MAKSTKKAAEKAEETVAQEAFENVLEEVVEAPAPKPQVIIMQPAPKSETPEIKGATLEDRLLNYVRNSGGSTVINDFLRIEYKTLFDQPQTAKTVKGILQKLVAEGKVKVEGDWQNLGKFYYLGGDPVTKYHTAANTKILVTAF